MSWVGFWWVLPVAGALVGYGRALAGVTRAQRAVWAVARVVEVRVPAHGASGMDALPVTLAFQDPLSGAEFRLGNEGAHGEGVHAAWVGREFTVRYPPGQPERFHLMRSTDGERHGLTVPNCCVWLLAVGAVAHAWVVGGPGWGLLGLGALLVCAGALSGDIGRARERAARLASAVGVPARVVAVTEDIHTDGEGTEIVSRTPVVVFTTRDGVRVTALLLRGAQALPGSLGRELTVHYAVDDPSVFTPDLAFDRRERGKDIAFVVALWTGGLASMAVGAALL
ncbi:DUF3592 domain-containing protein [Streptomyces sp. ACT015]|uniref:DUF3592 domain-containing protein n=1 Tax=Streptomyces sp. ACT015 TaxID=3134807 RepID=UPI003D17BDCA